MMPTNKDYTDLPKIHLVLFMSLSWLSFNLIYQSVTVTDPICNSYAFILKSTIGTQTYENNIRKPYESLEKISS